MGFPGGSVGKNPPADAGNRGPIPGWGRSPEGGNGNPLQYSCLGNPTDRGAWWATVYGVAKSWKQLSDSIATTIGLYLGEFKNIVIQIFTLSLDFALRRNKTECII